jgi:hypothetical protein
MSRTPDDIGARNMRVQIGRARDSIKSRDDLVAYIHMLIEAVDAGVLDRTKTFKYVDGLSNAMFGVAGWCRKHDEPVPRQPDWRWFGRLLTTAFI